jgi:phosphoglycerate dehydrogenase-like enzyme
MVPDGDTPLDVNESPRGRLLVNEPPRGRLLVNEPPRGRLLVVDGNAKSRTWAIKPDDERRIRDATPEGWSVYFVKALTSSDGDGPPVPNDEVMSVTAGAEAYLGFGMPRALFLAARRLRWVHSLAAGVGSALYAEMVESPVLFTNSAGIHAIPIAEYVVAGVMHFVRGLDIALAQQHRAEWNKMPFVSDDSPLREMSDARVLIIGTGGIGTEVAKRFTALGATCVGVRRRPELGAPSGFERVVGQSELDSELRRSNVIVVTAPLTAETSGLLSAERLDLLPPEAIVANVARGALLNESALIERLRSRRIRGAVLDVFDTEPLPHDNPLWGLPSVVVSPHVSPVSPGKFWPRQLDLFLENWRRYVAGAPLLNLVDKHAGY